MAGGLAARDAGRNQILGPIMAPMTPEGPAVSATALRHRQAQPPRWTRTSHLVDAAAIEMQSIVGRTPRRKIGTGRGMRSPDKTSLSAWAGLGWGYQYSPEL